MQTGIGRFIGEAPNSAQAQIDGSESQQTGLKVAAIAENHRSVQGQARFQSVPIDELVDDMAISSLAVNTGQAVQNCRL